MEENLNQVIIQTKSYAESVQNGTTSEKNQTTIEKNIDLSAIMKETKNAKLTHKKRRNLTLRKVFQHKPH